MGEELVQVGATTKVFCNWKIKILNMEQLNSSTSLFTLKAKMFLWYENVNNFSQSTDLNSCGRLSNTQIKPNTERPVVTLKP